MADDYDGYDAYDDFGEDFADEEFQDEGYGNLEEIWTRKPEDDEDEANDVLRRGADDDYDPENPIEDDGPEKVEDEPEPEPVDELDDYIMAEEQEGNRSRKVHSVRVTLIHGNERRTVPIVTELEKVRLISVRAEMFNGVHKFPGKHHQTERWAAPLIDYADETDSLKIAELEFFQKKIPLKIHRPIGNNRYEVWDPNQMQYLVR